MRTSTDSSRRIPHRTFNGGADGITCSVRCRDSSKIDKFNTLATCKVSKLTATATHCALSSLFTGKERR